MVLKIQIIEFISDPVHTPVFAIQEYHTGFIGKVSNIQICSQLSRKHVLYLGSVISGTVQCQLFGLIAHLRKICLKMLIAVLFSGIEIKALWKTYAGAVTLDPYTDLLIHNKFFFCIKDGHVSLTLPLPAFFTVVCGPVSLIFTHIHAGFQSIIVGLAQYVYSGFVVKHIIGIGDQADKTHIEIAFLILKSHKIAGIFFLEEVARFIKNCRSDDITFIDGHIRHLICSQHEIYRSIIPHAIDILIFAGIVYGYGSAVNRRLCGRHASVQGVINCIALISRDGQLKCLVIKSAGFRKGDAVHANSFCTSRTFAAFCLIRFCTSCTVRCIRTCSHRKYKHKDHYPYYKGTDF